VGAFWGRVVIFVDFQIQKRLKKVIFITWAPQYDMGRASSNLTVKVLEVFHKYQQGPIPTRNLCFCLYEQMSSEMGYQVFDSMSYPYYDAHAAYHVRPSFSMGRDAKHQRVIKKQKICQTTC
jgi:hypothetical protein